MNKCMISHATLENKDWARQEWFRQRAEKRRQREADAKARPDAETR